MNALITDPMLAQELILQRQRTGADRYDEVWDGVYIMSPIANNEHQWLAFRLAYVLQALLGEDSPARIYAGVNVSDREGDWSSNYRCPDIAVALPGSQAKDCDTHLCGGPDFLVEIVSPHDRSREKLDFYGRIGAGELLVIDREPWSLELYRRHEAEMRLVGATTPTAPAELTSQVLPVAFCLIANRSGRPGIEVTKSDSGGRAKWTI